jgi:hypothetical protein
VFLSFMLLFFFTFYSFHMILFSCLMLLFFSFANRSCDVHEQRKHYRILIISWAPLMILWFVFLFKLLFLLPLQHSSVLLDFFS